MTAKNLKIAATMSNFVTQRLHYSNRLAFLNRRTRNTVSLILSPKVSIEEKAAVVERLGSRDSIHFETALILADELSSDSMLQSLIGRQIARQCICSNWFDIQMIRSLSPCARKSALEYLHAAQASATVDGTWLVGQYPYNLIELSVLTSPSSLPSV